MKGDSIISNLFQYNKRRKQIKNLIKLDKYGDFNRKLIYLIYK